MRKEDQLQIYLKKYFPEMRVKDARLKKLELLTNELLRWNQSINLTSIQTREGVLIRHICDSLAAMQIEEISLKGIAIDAGSGGGFPGFVLAIMNPELVVHSVEKSLKKISFQRNLAQKLELDNFSPILGRIENHPDRNFYDLFFARAFAETKELLKWADVFLIKKGKCVLWKGKKFDAEWNAISAEDDKTKFNLVHTQNFEFEDDDFKTKIVVFQK